MFFEYKSIFYSNGYNQFEVFPEQFEGFTAQIEKKIYWSPHLIVFNQLSFSNEYGYSQNIHLNYLKTKLDDT